MIYSESRFPLSAEAREQFCAEAERIVSRSGSFLLERVVADLTAAADEYLAKGIEEALRPADIRPAEPAGRAS